MDIYTEISIESDESRGIDLSIGGFVQKKGFDTIL